MALPSSYIQAEDHHISIQSPKFMVSIPPTGSMVSFNSNSPEKTESPMAITREGQAEITAMEESQDHDSGLSELQGHEEASTMSTTLPQSENPETSKDKSTKQDWGPEPSDDEVINVALTVYPMGNRFGACPWAFDTLGRLRHSWGRLRWIIQQAREDREIQEQDSTRTDLTNNQYQHLSAEKNQQTLETVSRKPSRPKKRLSKKPRRSEVQTLLDDMGIGSNTRLVETGQQPSARQEVVDSVDPSSSFDASILQNSASASGGASGGAVGASRMHAGPVSLHGRPETIVCSDQDCAKKHFNAEYLDRHCGIQLSDARDEQRRDRVWLCPECAHKAKTVQDYLSPVVHGSITRLPKFGNERLDDDVLRDPLRQLSGLLANYMATASNKPTLPNAWTSIWDNSCVHDEGLGSAAGPTKPIVPLLRKLLDVPEGVSVKEKVENCQLHEYRNSIWLRAILVSLFSDFVFHQGSPYDDDKLLHESLTYGK
jgi:hypothetical protein